MEKFELASKKKYRYPYRGMITTEDLWDLDLKQLDTIYKTLAKSAKAAEDEDSLMNDRKADTDLVNMMEIVKAVFTAKKDEANAAKEAAEKAKKKERLLEILAQKQDASLNEKSEDEIRKMIEELG